jgi:hypothetical protein
VSSIETLGRELRGLIPGPTAEALTKVQLPAVEPSDLRQQLARLRAHVPPAYLPFATFDGFPLAIHLFPGREMADSPVVYIGSGSQAPKFVCGRFGDLPRGVWLWVAAYQKRNLPSFRSAIEILERTLPASRPVPSTLWDLLEGAPTGEPTWWGYRAKETTTRAWLTADVEHPFVKLGDVDYSNATKALDELQTFVASETDPPPLILSALIAAQLACGQTPSRDRLLAVLAAEAWLGGETIVRARWWPKEQGMAAWSVALKAALAQGDFLSSTPFAPLVGHPEAYSGTDKEGPALLEEVAQRFRDGGDRAAEVRQRRNAAFLSLYTRGGYSQKQIQEIGDACERVQPASLAATLARAYGEVTLQDA